MANYTKFDWARDRYDLSRYDADEERMIEGIDRRIRKNKKNNRRNHRDYL